MYRESMLLVAGDASENAYATYTLGGNCMIPYNHFSSTLQDM